MDYIVSKLMTMQENYINANSALTRLVKEQRATENSINNIMTAIENGGTSNTAMKRLRELEEKNAELEKQIRIEQSHSAFKLDRKEITDFYKFALEQEPKIGGLTTLYAIIKAEKNKEKEPKPRVRFRFLLAESEGFEPPDAFTSTVFKTAAIDHSANFP